MKIVVKILLMPVILVLTIINLILKAAFWVYSHAAGPVILILGVLLLLAVIANQWQNFWIILGVTGAVGLITFISIVVVAEVELFRDRLVNFVRE